MSSDNVILLSASVLKQNIVPNNKEVDGIGVTELSSLTYDPASTDAGKPSFAIVGDGGYLYYAQLSSDYELEFTKALTLEVPGTDL